MSSKKKQIARRRLLKALSITSAALTAKLVPESWTRPVVASTMLPAQAQMTDVREPQEPGCEIINFAVTQSLLNLTNLTYTVFGTATLLADTLPPNAECQFVFGTNIIPPVNPFMIGAGSYSCTNGTVFIGSNPGLCGGPARLDIVEDGDSSNVYCSETTTITCPNNT